MKPTPRLLVQHWLPMPRLAIENQCWANIFTCSAYDRKLLHDERHEVLFLLFLLNVYLTRCKSEENVELGDVLCERGCHHADGCDDTPNDSNGSISEATAKNTCSKTCEI